MALDAADTLFELADHDAVAQHRGVLMRQSFAQVGETGGKIVELAVMSVDDVGELVELSRVSVDDDDQLVELPRMLVEAPVLLVEAAVVLVETRLERVEPEVVARHDSNDLGQQLVNRADIGAVTLAHPSAYPQYRKIVILH
ncbi:MAG: hypothetical protein WA184_02045 [Stellaceae bacterium]|jgi:hypothetical protein